jgi:hypothetical protein
MNSFNNFFRNHILPSRINNTVNNYNKFKISFQNNIYINILEIKYFYNKIIIHICVYNREKLYILRKLRLLKINKVNYLIKNNNIIDNKINLLLKEKLILLNNKLYLYKYYTSMLFINNNKFSVYNLLKLKKILYNVFKKSIYFNITNIKYFHLNNDIFLSSLTEKLNKNRKNSILKLIRKSFRFAKTAKLHYLLKIKKIDNYLLKEMKGNYEDILRLKEYLINNVFSKAANIHIMGLRLESKGRLTKRLVASRAIKKLKYKGSLNNVYSSINKNSTIATRGFEKSNINYLSKNNYNLLGSYGFKY